MLGSSIIAHIALGCMFALFFVLYYINGDGKWKVFLEFLLGLGGNVGGIFILHNTFKIEDTNISMYSIASCLFAFIIVTFVFIVILSYTIKDNENDKIEVIRLRDIILGQTSWIKEFRDKRIKEIDDNLNYNKLKQKEEAILQQEEILKNKEVFINEEMDKLKELGNKKIQFLLPEKSNIIVSKEYIELMPSYFKDVVRCITEMNNFENQYLKNTECIDINFLKAYLFSLASSISSNIFNSNSADIRIHFRYYNKEKEGYEKLIAIKGKTVVKQDMTFIPYDTNNMIIKSYECKRALIKSINCGYDFKSNNYAVWKDYLTYTFYNLKIDDIPYLSFGISLKNEARYKKMFYFLNYINFEEYLQDKIEVLHNNYNLEYILYGGVL